MSFWLIDIEKHNIVDKMTKLELKTIIVLLIGLTVTCPLIEGQVKKGSGIHEQVDSSNESEGIGKDNSRLQTVEGKVKQPNPKVRSRVFCCTFINELFFLYSSQLYSFVPF